MLFNYCIVLNLIIGHVCSANCHAHLLVPVVKHLNAVLEAEKNITSRVMSEDGKKEFRRELAELNHSVQIFYQCYHSMNGVKGVSALRKIQGDQSHVYRCIST